MLYIGNSNLPVPVNGRPDHRPGDTRHELTPRPAAVCQHSGVDGHPLKLADGRILCAYASYHLPFGVFATLSEDNGLTWDLSRSYILDEYEYYDGKYWVDGNCGHLYQMLLDDGSILTCHGNYLLGGVSLIRWRP